ncbi:hypothetical protein [Lentzea kentuckyensis]|uniref:hypothetical protein n=1 Tax=Lentzea kentuckyensis TaxID=360086 RepID=UPI00146FA169|nr:hypothetical protein [Lentzea kentuckyensis]
MNPEAPDADVAEQQLDVVPQASVETPVVPIEADPADALDQQREVPVDDEDRV